MCLSLTKAATQLEFMRLLYLQFAGGRQNIDYNSVWVQKAREPEIYNHQAAFVHKN